MFLVAHRGGSPEDGENSAAAFRYGMRLGVDLLECDLQLSASGDIVVYHDSEYFGAPLASFTTDELRALIPTLLTFDELLDLVREIGPAPRLVLDLKCRNVDRSLAAYLEDPALRDRVLVTSTFAFGLRRLQRRFPELRTGLSRGATLTRVPRRLRPLAGRTIGRLIVFGALALMTACRIETAAFQHDLLDRWSVNALHRRGRRVDAWTVDDPARAAVIQALGVDYLTTNVPAIMRPRTRRPT